MVSRAHCNHLCNNVDDASDIVEVTTQCGSKCDGPEVNSENFKAVLLRRSHLASGSNARQRAYGFR